MIVAAMKVMIPFVTATAVSEKPSRRFATRPCSPARCTFSTRWYLRLEEPEPAAPLRQVVRRSRASRRRGRSSRRRGAARTSPRSRRWRAAPRGTRCRSRARAATRVRRWRNETNGSSASARKSAIRIHVITCREIQMTSSSTATAMIVDRMRSRVRVRTSTIRSPIARRIVSRSDDAVAGRERPVARASEGMGRGRAWNSARVGAGVVRDLHPPVAEVAPHTDAEARLGRAEARAAAALARAEGAGRPLELGAAAAAAVETASTSTAPVHAAARAGATDSRLPGGGRDGAVGPVRAGSAAGALRAAVSSRGGIGDAERCESVVACAASSLAAGDPVAADDAATAAPTACTGDQDAVFEPPWPRRTSVAPPPPEPARPGRPSTRSIAAPPSPPPFQPPRPGVVPTAAAPCPPTWTRSVSAGLTRSVAATRAPRPGVPAAPWRPPEAPAASM